MVFKREKISDIIDDILPLLKKHHAEISDDADIAFDPNFELYKLIEDLGNIAMFTVRDKGELIGYNSFFINFNLHFRSSFQAVQDVIYIDKDRRGFGRSFIDWCNIELKKIGIQKVHYFVKKKYEFGPLLERSGFNLSEHVYSKRLDRGA